MELADVADLKSAVRKDVPVQVRPWAPNLPLWWNWQTRPTQNRIRKGVGSSPTLGTQAMSIPFPTYLLS